MEFTQEYLKSLKSEYAGNASDNQFQLWVEECTMRNLVPVKDVVLQIRAVKEWDQKTKTKIFKNKAIYITTIQALRKLAERTGKYAGQLPAKWVYLDNEGNPTIESEIPLPESGSKSSPRIPWAVKSSVLRKGFEAPLVVPARFEAYAQYFKGDNDRQVLNSTWATRGPEQLEKCAEALALRKAFPEELGGLYLEAELKDEEDFSLVASAPAEPEPKPKKEPKKKEIPSVEVAPLEPVQKTDKATGFEFGQNAVPAPYETLAGQMFSQELINRAVQVSPESEATSPASPITDADLPSVLLDAEKMPTADELKAIGVEVKKIVEQGKMNPLGKYLKKKYGKASTKELTSREWAETLENLGEAQKSGKLDDLLAEVK